MDVTKPTLIVSNAANGRKPDPTKARALAEAIAEFEAEYVVETADSPALAEDAYRLRHQVYCQERGYEPDQGGLEIDRYDAHSRHVVLRRKSDGEVVGAARLVLFSSNEPGNSFPMQQVCDASLLRELPLPRMAEVSRFAISKQRRGSKADGLMRLALVRGLVRLSRELGVTHWCAAMEPTLLRLLRASAIHFQPLGPLVEYHGLRQPAFNNVSAILGRMGREQPDLWAFITEAGRMPVSEAPQLLAA